MILWLIHKLTKYLKSREIIRESGEKYLTRYKILGFMPDAPSRLPFSVYLHEFHSPDKDDAPHNHPWKWSFSFVLSGSYWEYRFHQDGRHTYRMIRRFRFNWISRSVYHMVKSLHGGEIWTLFVAGPRAYSWGFYDGHRGHVEWRQYLIEHGIKPSY